MHGETVKLRQTAFKLASMNTRIQEFKWNG